MLFLRWSVWGFFLYRNGGNILLSESAAFYFPVSFRAHRLKPKPGGTGCQPSLLENLSEIPYVEHFRRIKHLQNKYRSLPVASPEQLQANRIDGLRQFCNEDQRAPRLPSLRSPFSDARLTGLSRKNETTSNLSKEEIK